MGSFEGVEGILLVSVSGSDTATITEVALVQSSGSGEIKGTVESQENGNFLARVAKIPSEEFVVRVKGRADSVKAQMTFERMSSTSLRGSNVTVTVSTRRWKITFYQFILELSLFISKNWRFQHSNVSDRC